VRTEVKFEKNGDNHDKNDPRRVDICLLREGNEANIHILNQGIRDVNLRVNPADVGELLEVKLAPHHYLKDGQTLWLNDLIKLSELSKSKNKLYAPMQLLSIDTGLPIQSLFDPPKLASAAPPEHQKGKTIPEGLSTYWPLVANQSYCFSQQLYVKGQLKGKKDIVTITPIPCSDAAEQTSGVFFWALALPPAPNSQESAKEIISIEVLSQFKALAARLKKNFIAKQYTSIDVIPACWTVDWQEVDAVTKTN